MFLTISTKVRFLMLVQKALFISFILKIFVLTLSSPLEANNNLNKIKKNKIVKEGIMFPSPFEVNRILYPASYICK